MRHKAGSLSPTFSIYQMEKNVYMKQVLLIDGSPLFREYLHDKLVSEQVTVETATGSRDAYTKIINILPDLIIIDVAESIDFLDDMLESKRNDPNACKIPIIVSGPTIPRGHVANLAKYGVVKYFSKPIKFDIFFESIGQLLNLKLTIDETPCILEVHTNGNMIFVEIAKGLNREKMSLLKYKITELIEKNNMRDPKIVLMMTNLELSFVDGVNLEILLSNIIFDPKVRNKNVKVLSFDDFTKQLIAGHPEYSGIEVSDNLNTILNSLLETSTNSDVPELVSDKILTQDSNAEKGSIEIRFNSETETPIQGDSTDTLRITIVDDDPVILKLLESSLKEKGAEVRVYYSGTEFMQNVPKEMCDILVLDIYIPDMNGYDILRNLQKMNFRAPILVYSQATMREAVIQALSLGAKSYLVKPQKPEAIIQKIYELVDAPE